MKWFRWYEGTSEDGKFRMVARNAGVTVATVIGVWAALLEDAAHVEHRGVAVRGEDFYGAILDLTASEVQTILEAMETAGMISVGMGAITVSKWKERQFETDAVDPTNAERQRRHRQKQKSNNGETPRNGRVTATKRPDTDTDTDTDSESEVLGPPENSEQAAASGPVEVSGLNGSTQLIVESFANWLSPYAPDFTAAHKSVAEAVQIYGPDAVRDGFADLKADHADGKVRALTVKAFYGFVRTAKERRSAKPTASGKPPIQTATERSLTRQRALLDKLDAKIASEATA